MKNEVKVIVRVLSDYEKNRIRSLYEEVFDDSQYFMDYYFNSYIMGTINFVCEYDGQIIGMATIHPKVLIVSDKAYKAGYVYAVATAPEHRGKGIMAKILDYIYSYAKSNDYEYLYLIPVNPRIYEGQGYKLIRQKSEIKINTKKSDEIGVSKIEQENLDRYLDFTEKCYKNKVSIVYDKDYFTENFRRLSINNSGIYCIFHKIYDRILGLAFISDEEELSVENLICDTTDIELCLNAIGVEFEKNEVVYKLHDIMFREVYGRIDELDSYSICINDEI